MKKSWKTLLALLLACLFALSFTACTPAEKVFESEAGLKITLNDTFYEKEIVSQTMYLESTNVIFVALKEDFSIFEAADYDTDAMTLKEYAEMVISGNNFDVTAKTDAENGLTYFAYERNISGKDYHYYAVVFKGSDAFWLCQFACTTSNIEKYQQQFVDWAKGIQID